MTSKVPQDSKRKAITSKWQSISKNRSLLLSNGVESQSNSKYCSDTINNFLST